ncbi:MAG: hypothetical protein M3N14_07935 [Bacteroidota bacterium]|nr:hypothetical protein [Bacteroidota bacterium]
MKTLIIILVAVAAGFVIGHFTFNGKDAKSQFRSTASDPADTVNTLNFENRDSSQVWVKNYKKIWNAIVDKDAKLKDDRPKSFTIKSQDVLNAMGIDSSWKYITKLRYLRLTLGYDGVNKTMKAFIQPVVNVNLKGKGPFPAGTALFFNIRGQIVDSTGKKIDTLSMSSAFAGMKAGKSKIKTRASDTGVYVADLSTPCPNTCGN